jgi:osmotically-inducible protein OsmY
MAMRSDAQLRGEIIEQLQIEAGVQAELIATAVKDGVVMLAGCVDTYAQRCAAERAVERVKDVRGIANELMVKLPGTGTSSDADLAHAAVNVLRGHAELPAERIRVKVSHGWVTLAGEVGRPVQRVVAEGVVRALPGVRGVSNVLALSPSPASAELEPCSCLLDTVDASADVR